MAETELPDDVIAEVERLTRLERRVVDPNEAAAYRENRDALLEEYGFEARVRSEDRRDVLVCHPAEWMEDGTVRSERIDDIDRAVERVLDGPGDEENWAEVDAHNREIVNAVRSDAGEVHAMNAAAFADFMSNHYVRPIGSATRTEVEEFLAEYYPRNAWPTTEQKAAVEESLTLVFDAADVPPPEPLAEPGH